MLFFLVQNFHRWFFGLVFVSFFTVSPAWAFSAACGITGNMECTATQSSSQMSLCNEAGAYTWLSNLWVSCGGTSANSNAEIAQKAECFSNGVAGCPGSVGIPPNQ